MQAIARSHRIGQTKEVRVIHLEAVADAPANAITADDPTDLVSAEGTTAPGTVILSSNQVTVRPCKCPFLNRYRQLYSVFVFRITINIIGTL